MHCPSQLRLTDPRSRLWILLSLKDINAFQMTVPNDVALYELAIKAGVPMDNKVFRRIYGLIALGCSPDVIFSMLKYLTSIHSTTSTELVGRNSISNVSTASSRIAGQHHQVNRSKFTDSIVPTSRNLESQLSFLSTFSDCEQYPSEQDYESCKILLSLKMTVPNDVALYELAIKAGVPMDNKVFRRIYGLIALGCSPDVIFSMLKYLTSIHSTTSTELVGRNSISNVSTASSRIAGQHHQVNRSKFTDSIVPTSRNLESQLSFLSTFSDCEQDYESCKVLLNKPKVTQHKHLKPNV
ncbi:unnamed protein product [Schistosoma turkestanicum]|nr:unnamed protein product [Schistosoma turkestanicum]